MDALLVGGAVRDQLLGLPISDKDYVVLGSSPEQMVAAGFLPVGKDFPVFIDPITKSEYALARTELKVAAGYHGFAFQADPSVTIEQDLLRRDLTINAMALARDGAVIDPYGGQRDLRAKVLRHVSDAFAQDPVRILRLSRFAARFSDFHIAPETMILMKQMVKDGEVDALVAERVWQEMSRGLLEAKPSRMFFVLDECGALAKVAHELNLNSALLETVDKAAQSAAPLSVVFACLTRATDDIANLCQRLRIPSICADLSLMMQRERDALNKIKTTTSEDVVRLLERCDALRKPERFVSALQVLTLECSGAQTTSITAMWEIARNAANQVPAGEIAAAVTMQSGPSSDQSHQPALRIKQAIFDARVLAVALALNQKNGD